MKNNYINQSISSISSGFTLVEVMAAVAVLSIGLIGGLTAITGSLRNISSGEDKIAAANLAAEGIELARNIRDTNWLRVSSGIPGASWDDGFGISNTGDIRRLKFFCGGLTMVSMDRQHGPSGNNWTDTLDQQDCNAQKCKIYKYKIDGEPDENYLCFSDNFDNNFEFPPLTGLDYRAVIPRTEFYRLVTATRLTADSIKIESTVKYKQNGVEHFLPAVIETLYNWK